MNKFTVNLVLTLSLIVPPYLSCNAAEALPKGIISLDGRIAPPLILKNMDGQSVDISTMRGNWIFVHFWASWCGPCRREIPTINEIYPLFSESKLIIIVINTSEDEDTVFNFLGIAAPELNPLMDIDGSATELWQPRGLPATFFVDPQGKLQFLALGGRPWNKPEYTRFLKNLGH